jgi:hypothetical protein
MSDVVKIKMSLTTRYVGSEVTDSIELGREDWEALSEDGKEEMLDQIYMDFLSNENYGGIWVEEE